MAGTTWGDRVVLITGAASGIGRTTAQELACQGARLVLLDRDERVRELAHALSGQHEVPTLALTVDVTDPAAMRTAVTTAVERFGRLDVVFANAGIAPAAPTTALTTDDEVFARVVGVDLHGVWNTVRPALPHIVASQGYVLLIGSVYSFLNGVVNVPYAMSKAAVEAFGRALRVELAPHGASAGVIFPGWIDTPIVTPAFGGDELVSQLRAAGYPGPLGKLVPPERVAAAAVRAMERRAARTVVPRRWLPVFWFRSLLNPGIDASLTLRPGFRRKLRLIEKEHQK